MRKLAVTIMSALVGLVLTSSSVSAGAYKTTPTSTITQISIVSKSSKRYKNYHGVVWLQHNELQLYRWGGDYCKGGSLSDLKVSMLFAAFRSKYNINIEYEENLHKGKRHRCIKSFTVRRS